jgi:hypothetical protein
MSGQPYKKISDIEKYRNQYIDALNLRATLDSTVQQAVKNYKETGALPAVSQMKDSRTTSEILADVEKLKRDIAGSLAKVGSLQFGNAVVQRILSSPLNQDNSLLVFTAQRVNDIVDKLTRLYTYGIKGDDNDVQQIVNFISTMYSDKNALASSTKDFLQSNTSRGIGGFTGSSNQFANIGVLLKSLDSLINTIAINTQRRAGINPQLRPILNQLHQLLGYISVLVPSSPNVINMVDDIISRFISEGDPHGISDLLVSYKDFVSTGIPNTSQVSLGMKKIETYTKNFEQESLIVALQNMMSILMPSEEWNIERLRNLSNNIDYRDIEIIYERAMGGAPPAPAHHPAMGPAGMPPTMGTAPSMISGTPVYGDASTSMLDLYGGFGPEVDQSEEVDESEQGPSILDMYGGFGDEQEYPPQPSFTDILNAYGGVDQSDNESDYATALAGDGSQSNIYVPPPLAPPQPPAGGAPQGNALNDLLNQIRNRPQRQPPAQQAPPVAGDPAQPPQQPPAMNAGDLLSQILGINLRPTQTNANRPPPTNNNPLLEALKNPTKQSEIDRIQREEAEALARERESQALIANKAQFRDTVFNKLNVMPIAELERFENIIGIDMGSRKYQKVEGLTNFLVSEYENGIYAEGKYIQGVGLRKNKPKYSVRPIYPDQYRSRPEPRPMYYPPNPRPIDRGIVPLDSNLEEGLYPLKRGRGRPKGSGIKKKYAETVASSISNQGIEPERRFIKFGRYLINSKKLNDGILSVKRPSGNGIMDFPSQRISSNFKKVIKTMIGGGSPSFSDLESLSEPERVYLHKLASKADIIDKFNIPTPSKSKYEQDIHDFEVMKGEIMSGNDSKELIKKFKLHILKLSKLGALPKAEVQDILETLLDLGY